MDVRWPDGSMETIKMDCVSNSEQLLERMEASSETYETEALCGQRVKGKRIEYLCKWAGFDDDECTWEPRRNLEKYDVHGYLVDVVKPLKEWEESVIGKAAEACFGKGDLHLDEENLPLSCESVTARIAVTLQQILMSTKRCAGHEGQNMQST